MKWPRIPVAVKLGFIFVVLTISIISSWAITQHIQSLQESDAAVIDAAGRNSMLSQRIGLYTQLVSKEEVGARLVLQELIDLYETSFFAVKVGGVAPGIANNISLPAAPEQITETIEHAEEFWLQYKKNAETIAREQLYGEGESINPEVQSALAYIEQNAPEMLERNHRIAEEFVAINKEKQRMLSFALVAILMVNAVIIVIGILIAVSISKQIKNLSENAIRIGHGDFSINAKIKTNDEIEDLGSAISHMVKDIKKYKRELAEVSEKRTKDLEKEKGETEKKAKKLADLKTAVINILDDAEASRKELNKSYRQLKELDKMKEDLISIVGHELKTPLTSITSLTQLLLDKKLGPVSKQQKESMSLVLGDARRLAQLIENTLDIKRLESGRITYNFGRINLLNLIKETIKTVESTAKEKNIQIDITKRDPVEVTADSQRIIQVVINLLTNSIKYGKTNGHVRISIERKGDNAVVSFKDDGRGMSKENLKKVFDKMYQVDEAARRTPGGLGFGLYISKRIIEEGHKGKMWAESVGKNKGSTFYFSLPIKK